MEAGTTGRSRSSQAPVVGKVYDLLLWYLPVTARFRRTLRYTVGERIDSGLLEIHGFLTDAAYGRERVAALDQAARLLDRVRLLTRLAHDLQALDHRRYLFASERLVEVGRMVGGWRRAAAARRTAGDGSFRSDDAHP